jgi:hypothetical protein
VQITRGYRTELDLNNKQITACKKHAGAARYAYNWGLKRKQEVYRQTGRRISAMELHRELNQLKQTELPWKIKSLWLSLFSSSHRLNKERRTFACYESSPSSSLGVVRLLKSLRSERKSYAK